MKLEYFHSKTSNETYEIIKKYLLKHSKKLVEIGNPEMVWNSEKNLLTFIGKYKSWPISGTINIKDNYLEA